MTPGPGNSPCCASCQATASAMWRRLPNGQIICQICYNKNSHGTNETTVDDSSSNRKGSSSNSTSNGNNRGTQREKLNGSGRTRSQGQNKSILTAKKSRRSLLKRKPMKAPGAEASIVTSHKIFHEGIKYQVGDIVSLVDIDGGIFFAQIRGFTQDQYGDKGAVLTWLLPTQPCPDQFDPSIFVLGPEEDVCRPIDCIEFVSHSPPKFSAALPTPYSAYAPLVQQSKAIESLLIAAETLDKKS